MDTDAVGGQQLKRNLLVTAVVAMTMSGFVLAYLAVAPAGLASGMMRADAPLVPPVKGYLDGREIYFIHTEASDSEVAKLLTDMMESPVLHVPALAEATPALLANVYVFKNGVKGDGPFGFQPDVFDGPPGTETYRPLRSIHLVTWKQGGEARELKSADEVTRAESAGELTVQRPGAVVNMPLLTWPGGQR